MSTTDPRTSSPGFRRGIALLQRLAAYHEHEVFGLEPALRVRGGLIVACNHSLATYDAVLLALAGYERSGRWFHAMADRLIFRLPALGPALSAIGFVEGTRAAGLALLGRGEVLGVLPGGMREGLRVARAKYEVDWRGRHGFVWLSLLSGAPIVLAACPRADDIFEQVDNPLTAAAYRRLRLPLPLFRGRGLTPVPRPVKLWHLLSEPIAPPVPPERVDAEVVGAHQALLTRRMAELMARARDHPGTADAARRAS